MNEEHSHRPTGLSGEKVNSEEDEERLKSALQEECVSYQFTTEMLASSIPVPPVVERLLTIGRLTPKEHHRVSLAIQEAITNSVDHGNLGLESSWKDECDEHGLDRYQLERSQRLKDPKFLKKKILIMTQLNPSQLKISIRDEGQGFVPKCFSFTSGRTPTDKFRAQGHQGRFEYGRGCVEEALQLDPLGEQIQVHGRGLAIILDAMDEVSYKDGGRELVMVKNLQ